MVVQVAACGLCHTDEHLVTGDIPVPHWPIMGGHEAAGEIAVAPSGHLYPCERLIGDDAPDCVRQDF